MDQNARAIGVQRNHPRLEGERILPALQRRDQRGSGACTDVTLTLQGDRAGHVTAAVEDEALDDEVSVSGMGGERFLQNERATLAAKTLELVCGPKAYIERRNRL